MLGCKKGAKHTIYLNFDLYSSLQITAVAKMLVKKECESSTSDQQ